MLITVKDKLFFTNILQYLKLNLMLYTNMPLYDKHIISWLFVH